MTVLGVVLVLAVLAVGVVAPLLLSRRGRDARAREQAPSSGWEYVLVGALLSAGGAGLLALDDPPLVVAVPLLWLGGLLATAGVVAIGVTLGSERAAWRQER